MEESTLSLAELLAEAAAAAAVNDRAEAERLYRRATERSPGNTGAWLGLAAAVTSPDEKRACFTQVLTIHPNNAEARSALQRLAQQAAPEQVEAIRATLAHAAEEVQANPQWYSEAASAAQPATAVAAATSQQAAAVLTCVNHPDVETTLRCNRCGRPMCVRCVQLTDVGYRCKDCIREQQNVYFTAESRDYVVAAVVSFLLAAVATPVIQLLLAIAGMLLGGILAFAFGPVVGGSAATLIRRSVGRRRGRYLGAVVVVAILLGMGFGALLAGIFHLGVNMILLAIFAFSALTTVYATLR